MANSTIELATELTVAWLSNPNTRVATDDVPAFIASMHVAIEGLSKPAMVEPAMPQENYTPAVSVRKSLGKPDRIISMIDGMPYASLKRHLAARGLTPDQYRERYGLKPDYPMVAPALSEKHRASAIARGFGRKPGAKVAAEGVKTALNKSAKPKGIAAAKKAAQAHLGIDAG